MSIQVTGTNLDVGAALRSYALDRLDAAIDKYVSGEHDGHVRVEKTRQGFEVRCSVRLDWGLELQASGESGDAHGAIDAAVERLDKRLRRHKRRLVDRHHSAPKGGGTVGMQATDYVLAGEEAADEAATASEDGAPAIVAETQKSVLTHSVSDAVMALELSDEQCLMFRNAGTGRLNVIYRRTDGNIGWIDPSEESTG